VRVGKRLFIAVYRHAHARVVPSSCACKPSMSSLLKNTPQLTTIFTAFTYTRAHKHPRLCRPAPTALLQRREQLRGAAVPVVCKKFAGRNRKKKS
jgi:hypothetical protein